MALAILAYLFARIPRAELWDALANGPWFWLGAYSVLVVLLALLADAYATDIALTVTGLKLRFSQIFLVRGATYLLGLLNYSLGQGAFGVYLQRSGVATVRAAGIMLFVLIVNFGVFLFMSCLGVLTGALFGGGFARFASLALGLTGGLLAYLSVVSLRPRFLQGWRLIAPLLEAGLGGHLRAAAGRMPHVLVLILTFWGALHLWGIPIPLLKGIILIPVILFLSALPITPAGLGTFQGSMVLLISPYVPLDNPEARAATVLAFSLVYHFLGIIIQAILGLWCFQKIGRLDSFRSCLKEDGIPR
ncbi:MAG: lysylphosphatidylglycerol synthase domain-containing protein [Desulfobaccales bacterium]